jgi:hypothetical protein
MTVWMYYLTDGDSGYYRIKLFKTKEAAKNFLNGKGKDAYARITEIEVQE